MIGVRTVIKITSQLRVWGGRDFAKFLNDRGGGVNAEGGPIPAMNTDTEGEHSPPIPVNRFWIEGVCGNAILATAGNRAQYLWKYPVPLDQDNRSGRGPDPQPIPGNAEKIRVPDGGSSRRTGRHPVAVFTPEHSRG